MALLGRPLLVLLSLLAVGLPTATYLLWSRLRGPRATRIASRILLLLSGQLVAVMLVGAAVNHVGFYYNSWSELASILSAPGSSPAQNPGVKPSVASAGTALRSDRTAVHVLPYPAWSTHAQWPVRGQVLAVRIHGARSDLSGTALVWLPPQYFQPAYAHSQFPGVVVLGGYPGSESGLLKTMKYPQHLLAEISAHRAEPMVLVMQRPAVTFPRDTECTDVPDGPQALSYFAQDVPAAIASRFRVRPTGWGAMGHSTGGYCAAKLAMLHSDLFPAAASLSGYYNTLGDQSTGDLWGGSPVVRNLNNLEWRLAHLPAPPVSLFVATSRAERGPNGYGATERFLSLVRSPLQVETMILPTGGHSPTSWAQEVGPGLAWLSIRLKAAR